MNQKELVHKVAKKTGKSLDEVAKVIEATLGVVADAMKENDVVRIQNFGKFKTVVKPAKTIKVCGKEYQTEEKTVVKFEQYEKFFFYGRR